MSLSGIIVLTRHGDRSGFYQNPKTYTASDTNLTVLGYLQQYKNGQDLRVEYLTSLDGAISGVDPILAESQQLEILADAGGEGAVIIESTNALLQGLYPPYNDTLLLANGTTIAWDSGRAQLIPIETLEPDDDIWLEGWIECDAWTESLNDFYASPEFTTEAVSASAFYQELAPLLGNRPLAFQNGYNIFDFMNVNHIHNATLSPDLAPHMSLSRYYANWRESRAFGTTDRNSVVNIAGQTLLAPILEGIEQIRNETNSLKIQYLSISYKPFISLFNMMNLPSPLSDSMVDYASMAVFEIRDDNTITMRFRNSSEGVLNAYPLFGSESDATPIDTFVENLEPYALKTLSQWCDKCQNSETRGCGVLGNLNGTGGGRIEYSSITSTTGRHHVSPLVAGVIGALVSLAVAAVALAAWLFFGGMAKRTRRGRSSQRGLQKRDPRAPSLAGSLAGNGLELGPSTSPTGASSDSGTQADGTESHKDGLNH